MAGRCASRRASIRPRPTSIWATLWSCAKCGASRTWDTWRCWWWATSRPGSEIPPASRRPALQAVGRGDRTQHRDLSSIRHSRSSTSDRHRGALQQRVAGDARLGGPHRAGRELPAGAHDGARGLQDALGDRAQHRAARAALSAPAGAGFGGPAGRRRARRHRPAVQSAGWLPSGCASAASRRRSSRLRRSSRGWMPSSRAARSSARRCPSRSATTSA